MKVGIEKRGRKGKRHRGTQCIEMLPAMLHGSAALAPYRLKNCDQDAAGRIYPKGVWFGEGPGPAGGRAGPAGRVCRSKRRVATSKRIVVRSMKSAQAQKNGTGSKKSFPFFHYDLSTV